MDRKDVILSLLLLQDSRRPYRELADILGVSVNAVHKRIQAMMEAGVIRCFTTRPVLMGTEGVSVWVFGRSECDIEALKARLCQDDSTYWLAVTGGDFLLVAGHLRSISELDGYVRYVVEASRMHAPLIGMNAYPPLPQGAKRSLSHLDLRIVGALARNSRRTVIEVAQEIGLSAKTVRRRLEQMEEEHLLEYSIEWYPDESNDIMSLVQVHLRPGADRHEVGRRLMAVRPPEVIFFEAFSNVLDQIFLVTWSPTTKELKALKEALEGVEGVARLVPNIIYAGYIFPTWRDRFEGGRT